MQSDETTPPARRDVTIRPPPAPAQAQGHAPTVWLSANWSRSRFEDMQREANAAVEGIDVRHARRREIIFAIAFAESYLFEWVRDDVLRGSSDELPRYFPAGVHRGPDTKWKAVLAHLERDDRIQLNPDLGGPRGEQWQRLIDYRNGLIHAAASRPDSDTQSEDLRPVPQVRDLAECPAGWALSVVAFRARKLHAASGTAMPRWLAPTQV